MNSLPIFNLVYVIALRTFSAEADCLKYHYIAVLQWLCRFNIFHLVPEGGVNYSELAQAANVSENKLKGVIRMAMTTKLFCEPFPGRIMHTSTSKLLATNPNYHDWAVFMCDLSAPTAASMVDAHKAWPNSDKKNQTAYNVAFSHDQPYFDHLRQQPERHRQFAGYMQAVTTSEGTDLIHLINGFDWKSLGEARVVDVSIKLRRLYHNILTFYRLAALQGIPLRLWLSISTNSISRSRICPKSSRAAARKPSARTSRQE